ncbi:J domain-containing protein [Haloarcula sp. S1CR25-12]|uniref:J domain-containing protein n=1 Tax=Haloarcula saliterrae TaxID=2950534 RepID=A0ABU2F8V1_9EURY|nr:J domain-containing protein [Haloarcula sp. S1CR25-12]MDS0258713.1 J domain-containing protein [Haloarcula sp. S1CR25-12]
MPSDFYSVLGVSESATNSEIQAALRKQSKRFHPDVCSRDDATDRFKDIQEAGSVLDSSDRAVYDNFSHTIYTKANASVKVRKEWDSQGNPPDFSESSAATESSESSAATESSERNSSTSKPSHQASKARQARERAAEARQAQSQSSESSTATESSEQASKARQARERAEKERQASVNSGANESADKPSDSESVEQENLGSQDYTKTENGSHNNLLSSLIHSVLNSIIWKSSFIASSATILFWSLLVYPVIGGLRSGTAVANLFTPFTFVGSSFFYTSSIFELSWALNYAGLSINLTELNEIWGVISVGFKFLAFVISSIYVQTSVRESGLLQVVSSAIALTTWQLFLFVVSLLAFSILTNFGIISTISAVIILFLPVIIIHGFLSFTANLLGYNMINMIKSRESL